MLVGPHGAVRYTTSPAERGKKIDAGKYRLRVEGADGLAVDVNEFTIQRKGVVSCGLPWLRHLPLRMKAGRRLTARRRSGLLSVGGTVIVKDILCTYTLRDATLLRDGPFEVLAAGPLHTGGRVNDAGLERLKGLKAITEVSLYGTDITDAGLVHLEELSTLKTLKATSTQVTDAGRVHLRKMRALVHLDANRLVAQ